MQNIWYKIPMKGSFGFQKGRHPQVENRCPRDYLGCVVIGIKKSLFMLLKHSKIYDHCLRQYFSFKPDDEKKKRITNHWTE